MRQILRNARVLTGSTIERGLAVVIADGAIEAVHPDSEVFGGTDLGGHILLPGFVDIQVNGGGGALFGEQPSAEAIGVIARAPVIGASGSG